MAQKHQAPSPASLPPPESDPDKLALEMADMDGNVVDLEVVVEVAAEDFLTSGS